MSDGRTDKKQHFSDKVSKVQSLLAADVQGEAVETKVDEGPKKGAVESDDR